MDDLKGSTSIHIRAHSTTKSAIAARSRLHRHAEHIGDEFAAPPQMAYKQCA
jgi:hypothetical protein